LLLKNNYNKIEWAMKAPHPVRHAFMAFFIGKKPREALRKKSDMPDER
jgi:hypothetical protein